MADLQKVISANEFKEGSAVIVVPVNVVASSIKSVRGQPVADQWTNTINRVDPKWKNNDGYQT